MTPGPLLDRELLRRAFDLLAMKLARRGVLSELHVFGGAAMVLAFDERASTRGRAVEPDRPVIEAAWEVAEELRLPRSWLNNQASSDLSGRAGRGTPAYDHPNLRVLTTPPEHLLAIKVRAARGYGMPTTWILERFFPGEPLSERSQQLVEDLLAEERR